MSNSDGKVRIIIDTNAETAAKQLNDVGTAFKKNADTIQKASSVYGGFEKAVNDNIQTLRELALGGNQNTDGFKKLAEETKNYKKALDEANQSVNKAIGGMNQQSNPVNALTSKLKGLVGAYLSIRGAQAVFNGIMQSTEAYRQQERAIAQLNTTLSNAGVYSAQYSEHIQAIASQIQNYSNYGDEAIIKAQALGQSFIGQTKITDELTRAVVDFASATGMDLEQAFTLVGKSIGSSTNALGRYGIELQKGMTDSEKMTSITVQLGNRYEGQARQMANASVQLKNALGDLAEEIGRQLNPAIEAGQKLLLKLTQTATNYIKSNSAQALAVQTWTSALNNLEQQAKNASGEEKKRLDEEIAKVKKVVELKKQSAEISSKVTNKTPIKIKDEFGSFSAPATARTIKTGTSSTQAKQIKDAYDLATESVEKARRAVLNAGLQFGTSSPEVARAFEQYKQANEQLTSVQDIFKIEETKGAYQQLTTTVTELTAKLRDLAAEQKIGSAEWDLTKNALAVAQADLTEVNKALDSEGIKIEDKAKQISESLTTNLFSVIRNGGNAFEVFSNIAVNALQKIISKILEMTVIQPILSSLGGMTGGGFFGTLLGGLFGSKNGNVFRNGNVIPFAKGGVVNKPTLFPMKNGTGLMGEAGAEAIMPLKRKNGKLGVEATNTNQTVVNIYNQSGASVETQKRDDGGMDVFIKKVNSAMMNERTSSGFRRAYERENTKGVQAC